MSHRVKQLESALQRTIGAILVGGLNDPRVSGLISVTGVEITRDGERAKVGISVLPEDKAALTVKGLRAAAKHIRHEVGDKLLVHNYGHGGAGVTLSWGCAEEAADLLRGRLSPGAEVAVLGAGVSGLSTARVLQERGHPVSLFAASFSPQTTSDVAGAQWAPSLVAMGRSPDQRVQNKRIMERSFARFQTLSGSEYGVFPRANYATLGSGGGLQVAPRDLVPLVETFDKLPFGDSAPPGRLYRTLLIEPPIYMPRLMHEVESAGARIVRRSFHSKEDMLALRESAVVNCLGLGGASVTDDRSLVPIRGQLVHLEPQALPYLLSHAGYVFPRRDGVVLGGTIERNVTSARPDPSACRRILERNRRFFEAG